MNRKISVGMTVTIVILAMTVTFSITMLMAMRLFDHTVTSVKEKESMYNKVAEVDRYVRANDYYDIDHLILPVLTLTIVSMSDVILYTRQKIVEIMNSDFILYAKARGESQKQLITRHILRNVILPAVTVQFASFSELFGGMALAENVFSYPGIGTATTAAALNADVPLLLGIALCSAMFVFAGNLMANILYGVFDPRIREGEEYV